MLQFIVHSHAALTTMPGVAEREEIAQPMEMLENAELESVVAVLAFFNNASKQLSASKQPTGFLVSLMPEHTRRQLQPSSADLVVRELKVSLLRGLLGSKFGGKVGDELYLAMTLHPRYRRLQQATQLDDETRSRVQELLKTEAVNLYIERAKDQPTAVPAVPPAPPMPSTSSTSFTLDLDRRHVWRRGGRAGRAGAGAERVHAGQDRKDVKSGGELLLHPSSRPPRVKTFVTSCL